MITRSLIIDGWDTAADGHMTLAKLNIELPSVYEERQKAPGLSGDIDLSEAAAGYPTFSTRNLTATLESSFGLRSDRIAMFDLLSSKFHGKNVQIHHPDAPGRYYYGRLSVSDLAHHMAYSEAKLTAVCQPYAFDDKISERSFTAIAETVGIPDKDSVEAISNGSVSAGIPGNLQLVCHAGVGEEATFCVSAAKDAEYYLSMRHVSGKGRWSACATGGEFQKNAVIRTASDGCIWIRLEKFSTEALRFSNVHLLKTSEVASVDVGDAPLVADISTGTFMLLSVDGECSYIRTSGNQVPLSAGKHYFLPISDDGGETVTMRYQRRFW